jgi:hypothetical protein
MQSGVKLRTRALSTTLFARLMLGDLFLHGIGGAKYDQVTDRLARQFFGFSLPEFAAVSATLRLPIRRDDVHPKQPIEAERQLRELRYHPERFVDSIGSHANGEWSRAGKIIEEKRRWIGTPKTRVNARQRHLAIAGANEALQPFVDPLRKTLESSLDEVARRERAEAILNSREYAFCLYPRERLESALLDDKG